MYSWTRVINTTWMTERGHAWLNGSSAHNMDERMGIGGLMMASHLTWMAEGVSTDGLNGSQTHSIDGGESGHGWLYERLTFDMDGTESGYGWLKGAKHNMDERDSRHGWLNGSHTQYGWQR